MKNETQKLNIAPATKRYYDYGDLLDTVEGIVWLTEDGYVFAFEEGKTVDEKRAAIAAALEKTGGHLELVVHDRVHLSHDMNPRGLI